MLWEHVKTHYVFIVKMGLCHIKIVLHYSYQKFLQKNVHQEPDIDFNIQYS